MLQLWELPAIPSNHHTVQPKGESEPRHRELEHARSERGEAAAGGGGAGLARPGPGAAPAATSHRPAAPAGNLPPTASYCSRPGQQRALHQP